MHATPDKCASAVLATVLVVMNVIRTEIRNRRSPELTVPQFRSLVFVNKFPGAALSDLAEHVGISAPAMSKMVDGLVRRELVSREISQSDRRRISLAITPVGRAMLARARQLASLPPAGRADLLEALGGLRALFTAQPNANPQGRAPRGDK